MPISSRKAALPISDRRPSTSPVTPLPVGLSKPLTSARCDAALLRRFDDRGAERVLARPLEAGGEAQKLVLGDAGRRLDRRHRRPALGQRAGLVDDKRVDLLHALERLGVA